MKSLNWKYLRYLFWLAPGLITAGLVAGAITGTWSAVPLTLISLGILLILTWAVLEARSPQGFWAKRSSQAQIDALVATIAVVIILGLINFLGVRYASQIDLTENQIFTLAPQSKQVLQSLDEPVKVWIFDVTPNPQDDRLLKDYERETDLFTYEYVDPQANPLETREFGVQVPGAVYLEVGDDRRFLQSVNLQERLSERTLTTAIAQIGRTEQPKVYVIQGHDELPLEPGVEPGDRSFSGAFSQLQDENYQVEALTLATVDQVPEDANVVILAGPQRELLDSEVEALEQYLDRQSGTLLMLDPTIQIGLEPYLRETWGVTLGSNTIILDPDGQQVGLGPAVPIVTKYGVHPITQELNGISLFPIAQPIGIEEVEGVETTPLLITGDRAQVQTVDDSGQVQIDQNQQSGALAIGVALSRPVEGTEETAEAAPEEEDPETTPDAAEEEDPPEIRLVVVGNSRFASDGILDQQLNSDVFLNTVSWLSQANEQAIAIRPREMTNRRILLPLPQQILLGVTALLVLPLIGFGMALFTWVRRR